MEIVRLKRQELLVTAVFAGLLALNPALAGDNHPDAQGTPAAPKAKSETGRGHCGGSVDHCGGKDHKKGGEHSCKSGECGADECGDGEKKDSVPAPQEN